MANEAVCKRYGLEPAGVIGERIVLHGKPRMVAALAVRTSPDPTKLVPAIRAGMRAIDPDQPVVRAQSREQILSSAVARPHGWPWARKAGR